MGYDEGVIYRKYDAFEVLIKQAKLRSNNACFMCMMQLKEITLIQPFWLF